MNIRATLKALPIQSPSSNPIPTFPLRSAKPSDSNRPVIVTIPAPRSTPRIPSSGLCDRSTGSAARPGGGPTDCRFAGSVMNVALIFLLLRLLSLLGSHCYYCRNSRTYLRREGRVVKSDLNWHSLHDFGE